MVLSRGNGLVISGFFSDDHNDSYISVLVSEKAPRKVLDHLQKLNSDKLTLKTAFPDFDSDTR